MRVIVLVTVGFMAVNNIYETTTHINLPVIFLPAAKYTQNDCNYAVLAVMLHVANISCLLIAAL